MSLTSFTTNENETMNIESHTHTHTCKLVELLDQMNTPDERLLLVLTCCARLTDAVEAEDQNLFRDLEGSIDPLNLKRCSFGSVHTQQAAELSSIPACRLRVCCSVDVTCGKLFVVVSEEKTTARNFDKRRNHLSLSLFSLSVSLSLCVCVSPAHSRRVQG